MIKSSVLWNIMFRFGSFIQMKTYLYRMTVLQICNAHGVCEKSMAQQEFVMTQWVGKISFALNKTWP